MESIMGRVQKVCLRMKEESASTCIGPPRSFRLQQPFRAQAGVANVRGGSDAGRRQEDEQRRGGEWGRRQSRESIREAETQDPS